MKLATEIPGTGNSNANKTLFLRGDSIFRSAIIVRVAMATEPYKQLHGKM